MLGWLSKRMLAILVTGFVASLLICSLPRLIPGDPIVVMLKNPTPERVAELRAQLGLDLPWYQQYTRYMSGILLHGDFGTSVITGRSVAGDLRKIWPATLELAMSALLLATIVGIMMGAWAARKAGSKFDLGWTVLSLSGVSIPVFWLGLLLMLLFSYYLAWLPSGGRLSPEIDYQARSGFVLIDAVVTRRGDLLADGLHHLVLPMLTLATIPTAFIARVTRTSVLESFHQPYVITARAKGVDEEDVLRRHALRPALVPILTMVGLEFSYLIGGAVLTETVFAWPGIGRFVTDAVLSRDYPSVQGALILLLLGVMLVQWIVDVLYLMANPRLRAGGGGDH
jgi:ABC-type dipeptide/oligopeptide/nickel transport system permease component